MIKMLDLFAGAGGLSLGFESTKKYVSVGIVEKNKNAISTFISNRSNKIEVYEDITDLDDDDFNDKFRNIDIIIGGPPCQGFSNANRQHKHLINGNNELVKKYIDTVLSIRPKVFLMENVPMILSKSHKFFCNRNEINNSIFDNIRNNEKIVLLDNNVENNFIELLNNTDYNQESLENIEEMIRLINISKKYLRENKKSESLVLFNKINRIRQNDNLSNISCVFSLFDNYIMSESESYSKVIDEIMEILKSLTGKLIAIRLIHEMKKYDIHYEINIDNDRIVANVKTIGIIDYVLANLKGIYNIQYDILNAYDFGVPQIRKRLFMIGILQTLDIKFSFSDIERSNNFLTVRDAIQDLETIDPSYSVENNTLSISNHVITKTTNKALEKFKQLKQGENFHSLSDKLKESYTNPEKTQNSVYLRLHYDLPSNTVMNVRKSMWIHPTLDRAISIREAARIQSFPDTYRFVGTKDMMYQQIGNAVPPVLAQKIAFSLYEKVFKKQNVGSTNLES